MTYFPRGYTGRVAQHTGQHLYNGSSHWSHTVMKVVAPVYQPPWTPAMYYVPDDTLDEAIIQISHG